MKTTTKNNYGHNQTLNNPSNESCGRCGPRAQPQAELPTADNPENAHKTDKTRIVCGLNYFSLSLEPNA